MTLRVMTEMESEREHHYRRFGCRPVRGGTGRSKAPDECLERSCDLIRHRLNQQIAAEALPQTRVERAARVSLNRGLVDRCLDAVADSRQHRGLSSN